MGTSGPELGVLSTERLCEACANGLPRLRIKLVEPDMRDLAEADDWTACLLKEEYVTGFDMVIRGEPARREARLNRLQTVQDIVQVWLNKNPQVEREGRLHIAHQWR